MTRMTVLYSVLGVGAATLLSVCDLCTSPAQAATTQSAIQTVAPMTAAATTQSQAPTSETVTLDVKGMTCGGCVIGVRTVLSRLPGVTKADVRYETHTAVVTFDPSKVSVAQMIAAIGTLKYSATQVAPSKT